MQKRPRLECPQCGGRIQATTSQACPSCGFYITPARIRHKGAVRYWHFARGRRWVEILLMLAWVAAACVALWLLSLNVRIGFPVLVGVTGLAVVLFGKFLTIKWWRKK